MRKKKKNSFPVKPALLLGAAALLLLTSTVGSTRAALTYYSDNYAAEVSMSSIGVSLLENGTRISSRDYLENGEWTETQGELLTNMLADGEKFAPGKAYREWLSVENSGSIDSYVRVIITKSWQDENGNKNTTLDPNLIELALTSNSGWMLYEDEDADYSDERMVLYYTRALAPGQETPSLSETIRINPAIADDVTVTRDDDGTTRYEYKYDGYSFCLEAEVDAVQTHNAVDAIKSAWGVDVTVTDDDGGTITGIN